MKKQVLLPMLLGLSALAMMISGVVLKYAILQPLGIYRREFVPEMPFVWMRDMDLQKALQHTSRKGGSADMADNPPAAAQDERVDKLLFIGGSRTCGLRDDIPIEGADYFCDEYCTLFPGPEHTMPDGETLCELLAQQEYDSIFVELGLPEASLPMDAVVIEYGNFLDTLAKTQPQARIVVQGILAVSRQWLQSPDEIRQLNDKIAALAGKYRMVYLDLNRDFADAEGYLPEGITQDGYHLKTEHLRLWQRRLLESVSINQEEYYGIQKDGSTNASQASAEAEPASP